MAQASNALRGVPAGARLKRRGWRDLQAWLGSAGVLAAIPMALLLLAGFLGPLVMVVLFSFMPPQTFSLLQAPTLANYQAIFASSYYLSFLWSIWLAAVTTLILLLVCYPVAFAMVRVFNRAAGIVGLLITAPMFVADNLRLFGWVLVLVKGGLVAGSLKTWLGIDMDSPLYTTGATLFGLVYTYSPFMLFPMILGLSMVPPEVREAAYDLGASACQVLREIDLPLAMPGILIGTLLTFILTAGAISEPRILGGSAVVMVAQEIQKEFTFAQNWPAGSALSVLMILLAGILAVVLLRRIDLDLIFGRKKS